MKSTVFFILTLFFASFTASSATLSAGANIEFLTLNGVKLEKKAKTKLELNAGRYQLVAMYEKNLKRGSKNSLFTSLPYVFDIEIGQKNLELTIPSMRSESQARAFFHEPKWELIAKESNSTQIIVAEELTGEGFAPFSDIEKAVALYNRKHKLEKNPISSSVKAMNTERLSSLKRLYTEASAEEKKAFKYWMLDNNF